MGKKGIFHAIVIVMMLLIGVFSVSIAEASSSKNTDSDTGIIDGRYTFTSENDWYGYESYLNDQGTSKKYTSCRTYIVTIPYDGHLELQVCTKDTPIMVELMISDSEGYYVMWSDGSSNRDFSMKRTSKLLKKGTYTVQFSYDTENIDDLNLKSYGKKKFYHKITYKGLTAAEKASAEKEKRKIDEANKKPLKVKNVWASKHEVGKVTFKWTKIDYATVKKWDVRFRIREIGEKNKWQDWETRTYDSDVFELEVDFPVNYAIEFHVKARGDSKWSQGVITTPAGGKYQAMKNAFVKNASTNKRITTNTITLKKGQTLRLTPDHEYPIKDFKKRPRLYPTHMLYDIGDDKIINIIKPGGKKYTGGIIDGVATVRALKKGKTTLICRSPNGRTFLLNITVR